MKWSLLAVGLIAGLAVSLHDDSCVETVYSGGRLIQCEGTEMFQPAREGETARVDEAPRAGVASIPLPPTLMALLGALLHGGCETSAVPEGQWTVCNDGFSLLERGRPVVAMALRLDAHEDPVAKAEREAAAARAEISLPVDDADCGPFPCSDYVEEKEDPKRNEYLLTLSDAEIARLGALIRAWDAQEIERELEEARANNHALKERLAEIAAHEAELEQAEAMASSAPAAHERVASVR